MLLARLTDEQGRGDTLLPADTHPKDYYRSLMKAGRVRCPDCDAHLIHVSAVEAEEEAQAQQQAAQAFYVNGASSTRVPHWRSTAIEDHAAKCIYRDDPHLKEHAVSFRKALAEGRAIRININFPVGFEGLRNRFNAYANREDTGLWDLARWSAAHPNHLSVPAHDITDILYYLQTAKELGGKDGLKQLHFHTHEAVQSCQRFVVSNATTRIAQVTETIYDRAMAARTSQQHYGDTPRLFLFAASERQQMIGIDRRQSTIFGELFMVPYPAEEPIKTGIRLKNERLSNQTVLDRGARVWVVGTPEILSYDLHRMRRKAQGSPVENPGKPSFLMIGVETRKAFGMIGLEHKKPLHATLPKRQLTLPFEARTGLKGTRTLPATAAPGARGGKPGPRRHTGPR